MQVTIINFQDSLWLETLAKIRHDIYHLPEYIYLEAERTKTIPEAFLAIDEDRIFFVPYLLRPCNDIVTQNNRQEEIFDVVSPYGYPGILLSESAQHSPEFAKQALDELKKNLKNKGVCSIFLRLHPILSENFQTVFPPNTFSFNGETVSMDLTLSEAQIWAHTRKGHQSTINKCKRLGLTARMVPVKEYLEQFIAIYEETMHRVTANQSYYFDKNYYDNLLKIGNKLHLCIVEQETEITAACLLFECCGIVQAHLSGTKTEFLAISPFNLLLHYVRLWGKERGNKYFHIGGGVGGDKDRLYTFKSGFSRQRHNFYTLRTIVDEERYFNLVSLKSQSSLIPIEKLIESNFFPAYRDPHVSK